MDPRVTTLLDAARTYPGAMYYIPTLNGLTYGSEYAPPDMPLHEDQIWHWNDSARWWYTIGAGSTNPHMIYEPQHARRAERRLIREVTPHNSNQDLVFKAH